MQTIHADVDLYLATPITTYNCLKCGPADTKYLKCERDVRFLLTGCTTLFSNCPQKWIVYQCLVVDVINLSSAVTAFVLNQEKDISAVNLDALENAVLNLTRISLTQPLLLQMLGINSLQTTMTPATQ